MSNSIDQSDNEEQVSERALDIRCLGFVLSRTGDASA